MQFTLEVKVHDLTITNVSEKGWLDYEAVIMVKCNNYEIRFKVRHTALYRGKTLCRPQYDDYNILYVDLRMGLGQLYASVKDEVEKAMFDGLKKKWAEMNKA